MVPSSSAQSTIVRMFLRTTSPLPTSSSYHTRTSLTVFCVTYFYLIAHLNEISMKGNVKKTFFTLALILVPILLLLFVVATAIAYLLFWEGRRGSNRNRNRRCAIWNRGTTGSSNKSNNTDTPRVSVSTKATDTTESELECHNPVQGREHV